MPFDFRDAEDSLEFFSGNSASQTAEKWVQVFDEVAKKKNWNAEEMFVYSRNMLRGPAFEYVESNSNIDSWVKLKKALIRSGVEIQPVKKFKTRVVTSRVRPPVPGDAQPSSLVHIETTGGKTLALDPNKDK